MHQLVILRERWYWKLKAGIPARTPSRTRFGRGYGPVIRLSMWNEKCARKGENSKTGLH